MPTKTLSIKSLRRESMKANDGKTFAQRNANTGEHLNFISACIKTPLFHSLPTACT